MAISTPADAATKIAGDTKGEIYDVLAERIAGLSLHLEARIHQLETLLLQKYDDQVARFDQKFVDTDLRYQQRFDSQGEALSAAFQAAKEAVASALASADRAVSKAEAAAEKRFEAVNEFRATLSDQATKFASRTEVDQATGNLLDKIDGPTGIARRLEEMGRRLDVFVARGGARDEDSQTNALTRQWMISAAIAVAGLIVAFAVMMHHPDTSSSIVPQPYHQSDSR